MRLGLLIVLLCCCGRTSTWGEEPCEEVLAEEVFPPRWMVLQGDHLFWTSIDLMGVDTCHGGVETYSEQADELIRVGPELSWVDQRGQRFAGDPTQPETIRMVDLLSPVMDEDFFYDFRAEAIVRVDRQTMKSHFFDVERPGYIGQTTSYLYFTEDDEEAMRVRKDGSEPPEHLFTLEENWRWGEVADGGLYGAIDVCSGRTCLGSQVIDPEDHEATIILRNLDGTDPRVIAVHERDFVVNIAPSGGSVFWATTTEIWQADRNGDNSKVVLRVDTPILTFRVDHRALYWCSSWSRLSNAREPDATIYRVERFLLP